jgi:hypothetical protein
MTEREWFTCSNPKRMLGFIQDKSSDRKLRFFVFGYFRITSHHRDVDEQSRLAVETSERFADGLATAEELEASKRRAREAAKAGSEGADLAAYAAAMNIRWAAGRLFGHITPVGVE